MSWLCNTSHITWLAWRLFWKVSFFGFRRIDSGFLEISMFSTILCPKLHDGPPHVTEESLPHSCDDGRIVMGGGPCIFARGSGRLSRNSRFILIIFYRHQGKKEVSKNPSSSMSQLDLQLPFYIWLGGIMLQLLLRPYPNLWNCTLFKCIQQEIVKGDKRCCVRSCTVINLLALALPAGFDHPHPRTKLHSMWSYMLLFKNTVHSPTHLLQFAVQNLQKSLFNFGVFSMTAADSWIAGSAPQDCLVGLKSRVF